MSTKTSKELQTFYSLSQVRAGFRTFQPKETKLIEENLKFNKKVISAEKN